MTERMGKLDRILRLIHLLAESGEGRTLDDMAALLGVNRRTAGRMRSLPGACLEFHYRPEGAEQPKPRRVIPYGLVHGPITYLIGKFPERDAPPVHYRIDRMSDVHISNRPGYPPEDWDLDAWQAQSFGIWRDDDHDIVLRIRPPAVAKARAWRFHPAQQAEEAGDELFIRFRAGGLREIAEHLFTWGGDVVIEGPEALREVMRERLETARLSIDTPGSVVPGGE